MLDSKHFDWSLFVGHLALEKILKAHWVKNNAADIPPKIHHLVRLANEAKLSLTDEQSEFLADVNGFNTEARYPEQNIKKSADYVGSSAKRITITGHRPISPRRTRRRRGDTYLQ